MTSSYHSSAKGLNVSSFFSYPRGRSGRRRSTSAAQRRGPLPRGFEVLEARHALTAAELLPTLAEVREIAYQTADKALFFTNQQKAETRDTNVGGEVLLYSLRPAFTTNYAFDVSATRDSSIDPAIALYDQTGQRVALNDDLSETDSGSHLVVPLVAGQKYCLAVTSSDSGTTGRYGVNVTAQIGDDSNENNNSLRRATSMPLVATTQGIMADNRDLYRVVLKGVGRVGSTVSLDFDNSLGDIDLTLLDRRGREIARSEGTTNREVVSMAGRPAGIYFIDVHGYGGALNPLYTLSTNIQVGATRAAAIVADPFDVNTKTNNNILARATSLGALTSTSVVNSLTLTRNDVDFFKFTTNQTGTSSSEVLAPFDNALGDIDMELLDASGRVLETSDGSAHVERVSLDNRPAGTYYLKVYGYNGAANPSYSLRFNHGIVLAQPVSLPYQGPPIQLPPIVPPVAPAGAWTIAVYMTSTDLSSFAFDDINEMEYAASRFAPGVKIVVFWDQWSKGSYATGGGSQPAWGTAGRAVIRPDTNATQIATTFDIVGERNTGDPAVLRDFLTWTMTVAPAANYGIVMWDHGGGLSGINFDDESGYDSITVKELQSAVTQSGMSPKMLAYDACLMGNAELFYELRAVAPVQVASEEVINGPGYNYRTAFAALESAPAGVTAQRLAQGIVSSFTAQYGSDGASTIAAVSSAGMGAVAGAVKSFVTASANFNTAQLNRLKTVLGQATHFEYAQYVDLRQLMSRVAAATDLPQTARTAASSVVKAVDAAVFAKMADQRLTGGMSIYLPSKAADEMPDIALFTDWAAAAGWNSIVNRVLGRSAAVRSPRGTGTWLYAPRGQHG